MTHWQKRSWQNSKANYQRRSRPYERDSQNGNPSKINPEKMACFSSPKNDRQRTSISPATHHNFTSETPRSAPRFCQKPQQKRRLSTPEKLLQKRSLFRLRLRFLRRDDDRGGHLVLRLQVEQLDPLGAAARRPDRFRVDPDDLAELADHHQLAGLVHQVDTGYFTDLRRRLHVDDALAAARLQTVLIHIRALAITALRHRKNQARR